MAPRALTSGLRSSPQLAPAFKCGAPTFCAARHAGLDAFTFLLFIRTLFQALAGYGVYAVLVPLSAYVASSFNAPTSVVSQSAVTTVGRPLAARGLAVPVMCAEPSDERVGSETQRWVEEWVVGGAAQQRDSGGAAVALTLPAGSGPTPIQRLSAAIAGATRANINGSS